ncbi:hypothetical protein CPB85DRAFT_1558832 [Mucidula mucida]|nr:hypothetical protein CPB85DRAFT_1558832 [Mucidula mucida]
MSEKLSFRALQLSNEQRNAYGLRYHDFARYRKHCANRTHRIRSTLKMTHGKGREFKKLPPLKPEMIKDGHLHLLLMESERAWAYSQDLLAQSQKNTEHATTLRHSATGRFRRSVNWSTQLLSHCQTLYASSRLSAEGLLEVTVYTLILNGRFLRYREEFDDALVQLGVARHLLDELAGAARTSRDQALATLFGDEIGPEIRYCAHELGRAEAYNVDKIVAEVAATNRNVLVDGCDALLEAFKKQEESTNKRKTLQEIVWEGEPVPVRNPELVDVFLKVQDAQAKLESSDAQGKSNSKKSVAAYDAILLALSDAEEVAKKLADAQTSSGPRDISFVHAYIVYQLLSRRIQRDLRLMQALLPTTKGATDGRVYPAVVKLLDTVMQSLIQMRALSIVDDNSDLASGVDARISYTKASRCLYLARCFVAVKKYAEALTLHRHAAIHIRETQSHLSVSSEIVFFPLTATELSKLETETSTDQAQAKREWLAYNGARSRRIRRTGFGRVEEEGGLEVADEGEKDKDKEKKTQMVVEEREEEPQVPVSRGGLSGLLGGWWGK